MAARSSLLFLVFSLFLLVVIPIVSSEDKCAPLNKDVKVLKDKPYWQFEVSKDLPGCKRFSPPGNVSTTCVFYFSVCNPVPAFCPENSGICLANKFDYRPKNNVTAYTEFHSIGDSIPGPKAFKSEKKNFTLKFGAIVRLPPQPLSTNTIITFICNQNASWSDAKDSKVPYPPTVNYTIDDKGEILLYKIEFQYKGACQGGGGGGGGGGGSSDKPTKPLSVGSILLILFFPGIFLYCVVGVLINRGSGKTGKEMIPNSKFWTDLPGLISDGFSFFIAKITCTEMSTSRETYDRM